MDTSIALRDQKSFSEKGGDVQPRRLTQYIAGISVTMGGFAMGTCLAWTSPTQAKLLETMSESTVSWIAGCMPLGGAASVLPFGWAMDALGRKVTLLALAPPFIAGWLLLVFADPLWMFILGRFICGMMCGAFSMIAPVYTSEIADNKVRGMLGGFFQLMVTIGILFVYFLDAVEASYTVITALCAAVPGVFAVIFVFMPETPLQHLRKGRVDDARKSLRWFRGPNYEIDQELAAHQDTLDKIERENISFTEAFRSRAAQKGLLVAIGLMVFQQMSGVNAVIFFAATIFEKAGSDLDPSISAVITQIMQVVSTFASGQVVDRLGRRVLLLVSDSVMCICAVLLGLFFFLLDSDSPSVDSIRWLPLASLCIFNVAFSFGFGPIPWMMVGELFPPNIKGIAGSIACTVNWILAFVVSKFFSDMEAAMGTGPTFWFFAGVSGVGTLFVLFLVPETKGKSLQQIQNELAGGKVAHDEANAPEKF